jgi:hypothetical protein
MRPVLLLPLALLVSLAVVPAASLAADLLYLDATNSLIDTAHPVGTQWHELFPTYCQQPYTITGWKDNGDGILSYCDTLAMTNPQGLPICQHVVDVTITLELTRAAPPDAYPHFWDWDHASGGDPLVHPVCTWWVEIYPDKDLDFHIQAWEDNESGVLDFCDWIVDDAGAQYHVEGVHTDMVTEPADQCALDRSTWGRIKVLYR